MEIIIDGQKTPVKSGKLKVEDILVLGGKPKDSLTEYELVRVLENGDEDLLYSQLNKPKSTLEDEIPLHDQEQFSIRLGAIAITVNAVEHYHHSNSISFEEVVKLAFGNNAPLDNPNIAYSCNYFNGSPNHPEGPLTKGDSVNIRNDMSFTVTRADQS